MSNPNNIQYLIHKDIDKKKWDNCINNASNGLIYARSLYLDSITENWDALVLNDYEAVMPLTWKKKYGIRYCYQPPFMQQSGVFGEIRDADIKALIEKITSLVKYGDLMFNYENKYISLYYSAIQKINFILNLQDGYEFIESRYNKDLKENLKRAKKQQLFYINSTDINKTIALYVSYYGRRTPHIKAKDYKNFNRLCYQLSQNNQCQVREVKDKQDNLLASALLLKDDRRIYNIMNTTTEVGRKTEANHFLLDNIIQEFSGHQLLFDFEGSEVPGVKKFYEKFGPLNQPYYHWHYNNLPFPLRMFKK